TFEVVDAQTVYGTAVLPPFKAGGPHGVSNLIRKRYVDVDRDVVVSRTVLDDPLAPQVRNGAIENKSAWFVASQDPRDPSQCRLTVIAHIKWPIQNVESDGSGMFDLQSILNTIKLDVPPPAASEGLMPRTHTSELDVAEVPSAVMRVFAARGKRFTLALQRHLNDVIKANKL
ncbi:hypothetical protein As57867_006856, partial [Aphanomyces stellatus]